MKTIHLLTKEDISTYSNGMHFVIKTMDGTEINFDPDATKELLIDLLNAKEQKPPERVCIHSVIMMPT